MLSYVYRLVAEFRENHGYAPNLLYVNEDHLNRLLSELDDALGVDHIMQLLGMDLVINNEISHPHLAWVDKRWKSRAAL